MSGLKPENFADGVKTTKAARMVAIEKFEVVAQALEDPDARYAAPKARH